MTVLLKTFLIGVAVAAPVGAMGVLCIQRTLAGGWVRGVLTGLGIAAADATYAALAAFGVSGFARTLVTWQLPVQIAGGLALVGMGVSAVVRGRGAEGSASMPARGSVDAHGFVASGSAYVLTLTNPSTIMAFAAIFAGAGLVTAASTTAALAATVGVAAGSLAWWVVLASVVARVRHALTGRAIRAVSVLSGVAITCFGVWALVSAALSLTA